MPYVNVDGVKIYWREAGSGDPLLLIMGLGYSSEMWHNIESYLADCYRVIVLDNRGVGKSDVPDGIYSIETMMADAIAVLDAANISRTHIFGVSMGGYIAQTLAYTYPERVRGLVLGATGCGGKKTVLASEEVLALLQARTEMPPEKGVRALVPYIYSKSTPKEVIEEDIVIRLRTYQDSKGYIGQLQGIWGWSSYDRLSAIVAPTLILHGVEDQLVPPGNSLNLLEGIPNARLEMLENASHIFFTDQPRKTSDLVIDFLDEVD